MQARCADSVSDATAISNFTAIVAALGPIVSNDTTFAGVYVAANGSNVRNPVPGFTPFTGAAGSIVPGTSQVMSWCISGRAPSGRKSKVFIYGLFLAVPDTWKQDPLTTAELQGFQGLLNSQSDFWLTIDGTKPTWYFRATVSPNDHWIGVERA
jgi:hypothetical protein